ncbi:shikimate dehydrogenase [Leptospira adleri]|uniref:Shikimate dehydrogenase (NADP(+)) n=1 Tax=Leptospira adleri TaxID=2023186 RepID=A0A2M9YR97_9LEPT|nr:shikimate dehydrogenase [Leptospira adleri]PJZ54058.1 shikimate dehydrogenase [Leptospira adleri]PJZ61101.1 shikimate dehydrogenase [Leptospira adleri]
MNKETNQPATTFGIVGFPLSHSLSPLIHNSIYKDKGMNASYLVFETKEFDQNIVRELQKSGVKGVSVTIPHKERAFAIADSADEPSQIMKASNTLVLGKNSIHAYNTDGEGAYRSILEWSPESLSRGKTLILGSGGSARGIAYSLATSANPEELILSSRNETTGKEICSLISKHSSVKSVFVDPKDLLSIRDQISLVVHTTPLGMKGQSPGPFIGEEFFNSSMTLFDIVYNPLETPLVKAAKSTGAKIIPGSEMLLYQAMKQFELFTGVIPDSNDVKKTRERLSVALANR